MSVVADLEAMIFAAGQPRALNDSQMSAMASAFGKPRSRSEVRAICDGMEPLIERLTKFMELAGDVSNQLNVLIAKIQFKAESTNDNPERKARAIVGSSVAVALPQKKQSGMSLLALRSNSV